MDIYILRDGKETGPFSEETTHQMLKQGVVLISDPAWRPGMPEWIPLNSVLYPTSENPATPASTSGEPATAKQKAFLDYMGIAIQPDLNKEQAALLVNDAMEDPKNSARATRWNDERLKLHPDLFAAELQAKREGRAQRCLELCQSEGAEVLEGVTKAHCQVLVGYLDVKFPNWDANETEGTWIYFFPAVSEKFPQLVRQDWKGKLKYPEGPKVAASLQRRAPVAASPKRKKSSPIASLMKGLVLGLVIVALAAGGLYAYKHPEVVAQLKDQLAALQKKSANRRAETAEQKSTATPAPASAPDTQSLFSGTSAGGSQTASTPAKDSAPAESATPAPMASTPAMAGSNANDTAMNSAPAPALPEAGAAPNSTGGSLFDPPPSSSSSAGNTMESNTAAAAGAGIPGIKTTLALTQPLELQLPYGKIKVPAGTQLRIVEHDGLNVKVRFQNQTISIPVSATDLGGETIPQ